jgi:hypothetical protein
MIPSQLLDTLRFAGPLAPLLIGLWIFRKHIRISIVFDGRDSAQRRTPKKRKLPPAQ